jgi:DNA-directed RNA polymerase subunit RPC12/RpoP
MKIRNGFVSNSSSSSFVVNKKKTNISSLLKILLQSYKDYLNEYDCIKKYDWAKEVNYNVDKALSKIDNQTHSAIMYKTPQYKTYIWEKDKYIFIDTCNNINLPDEIYENGATHRQNIKINWDQEEVEKIKEYIDEDCVYDKAWKNIIFYDLFNDVYGLRPGNDIKNNECCRKCWEDLILISDELFCPHCNKKNIIKITEELVKQTMGEKNENS